MRIIELDAANWKTPIDFYVALLAALGAPKSHGNSINALIDSMIWGGINAVNPPYKIVVSNIRHVPSDVANEVNLAKHELAESKAYFQVQKGYNVIVEFEVIE